VCVCGNNALFYFLSYVASTSGGTAILSSRACGRRVSPLNPAVEEDTRAESMLCVEEGNGKECVYVCACVRACMCACVRACMCACVCGNDALCYFLSYVASTSGGTPFYLHKLMEESAPLTQLSKRTLELRVCCVWKGEWEGISAIVCARVCACVCVRACVCVCVRAHWQ